MSRFKILNQSNEKNEIKEIKHQSQFDFEKFEIEDEDLKDEISKKEEEIIIVGKQLAKKTLELGKMLFETQQLLSNYNSGTFIAWFTYMGFEKNMVYREIKRWQLFEKYKRQEIVEASVRTIEFINKNDKLLNESEVIEILEDSKEAPKIIKEKTREIIM